MIPTDNATGKVTGTRMHSPLLIVKDFDCSSPYIYKAVATGQNLESVEIKWYRINDAGQEVEYFNMLLEKVRIVSISPAMATVTIRKITIWKPQSYATKKSRGSITTATLFLRIRGMTARQHHVKRGIAPLNRITTYQLWLTR